MSKDSIYLQNKRIDVLNLIKPICEIFSIKVDYIIEDDNREILQLDDTRIGCTSNSMRAVLEELIGYIFIKIYCKNRWWTHKPQTMKAIKKYWEE